jgi:type I restriction enzyme, S subunit
MSSYLMEDSLTNCLDKVIDYRGKTPKKLGGKWSNRGFRAISANNVKSDGLQKEDTIRFVDSSLYRKWMKEEIMRGDIILTSEAPAGQVMLWNSDEKIVLSQRLYGLRVNKKIDNWFLKYYLQSKTGQNEILKNNSGSTVFGISAKTFDNIKVRYPIKQIQTRIGKILSTLDAKIELNQRINAELEQVAKILYDYWFVQFDFPNAKGKPYKSSGGKMVWNEALKREIPLEWEAGELSDIANITMGQSPPGESYNEDGKGMIFFQGCTDFGNRFPSVRQYTTQPTRFAKAGDILLSVRAPVGTINIAKEDCCIGRGLAALNSKNNSITYLFGVMINFKQIFDRRNVNGTTFGSITKDDLFSLKVLKPDEKILEQYQKIISPAFEKQNRLELENQTLTELRDWLLPMLMNGQVKVN